jgi:hypothetical protein
MYFNQVGFEPVAPTPYKNIFGKQMYKLPGLFTYGRFKAMTIFLCINISSMYNAVVKE